MKSKYFLIVSFVLLAKVCEAAPFGTFQNLKSVIRHCPDDDTHRIGQELAQMRCLKMTAILQKEPFVHIFKTNWGISGCPLIYTSTIEVAFICR